MALAIGSSGEPLDKCIEFFENASKDTFSKPRKMSGFVSQTLGIAESRYDPRPLRSALDDFFRKTTRSLFEHNSACRVAVTTARDKGTIECLVTNYNRPQGDWDRFEREDDRAKDFRAFEAGLATSAAPYYLSPFKKDAADYVDGAVYANCPARVALDEKDKLWPPPRPGAAAAVALDLLVSLGTGRQAVRKPSLPTILQRGFFAPIVKKFERQMDAEETWEGLTRDTVGDGGARAARLHRLNPPVAGGAGGAKPGKLEYIELDAWREVEPLRQQVKSWAAAGEGAAAVRGVGRRLLASLFFFEPDVAAAAAAAEPPPEQGALLAGSVRCRLQHGGADLRTLLTKRVVGFFLAQVEAADVPAAVAGTLQAGDWQPVISEQGGTVVGPQGLVAVDEGGRPLPFRLPCSLPVDFHGGHYQALAVQFEGGPEKYVISGFPATMGELVERTKCRWLQ